MVYDFSLTTRINGPGAVQRLFSILKDVEKWPVWDVDLKSVSLKIKPLINMEGAEGVLTMNNGRSFPFTIHDVVENQYVAYVTKLPGASADWYWDFKKQDDQGLDLKMGVKISGSATFLWRMIIGPFLPAAYTTCLKNLKDLVEEGKVNGEPVQVGL